MSKFSFRTKALDITKPLPVYRASDMPEILQDTANISRAVPVLPTGMEKEEEDELHVREIINEQQQKGTLAATSIVIPTPNASFGVPNFDKLYPPTFKLPKQYIKVQLFGFIDENPPQYDMDTEDEEWLETHNTSKPDSSSSLGVDEFERLMERIESAYPISESRLQESMAHPNPALVSSLFSYYTAKLARLGRPKVMPQLKDALPDTASQSDPYVAFRKRVEKMQTRKNRQQQELQYINMLKLRRDLEKGRQLLEMVRKRETIKKDLLEHDIGLVERRCAIKDWDGAICRTMMPWAQPRIIPPVQHDMHNLHNHNTQHGQQLLQHGQQQQQQQHEGLRLTLKLPVLAGKEHPGAKHPGALGKKPAVPGAPDAAAVPGGPGAVRKPKLVGRPPQPGAAAAAAAATGAGDESEASEDVWEYEDTDAVTEDEEAHDNPFRFRRRVGVFYHAPLLQPVFRTRAAGAYVVPKRHAPDAASDEEENEEGGSSSSSVSPYKARRVLRGFCRRRVGRGGRVFIDRMHSRYDGYHELGWLTAEQHEDMADKDLPSQLLRCRPAPNTGTRTHLPAADTKPATVPAPSPAAGSGGGGGGGAAAAAHPPPLGLSLVQRSTSVDLLRTPLTATPSLPQTPLSIPRAPSFPSLPQTPASPLPVAGSDFGSGGEDIATGPKVRVPASPLKGPDVPTEWVPVSSPLKL